jgi:DHA1 family tetracycline resistance protein-like MFS transporter
MSFLNKNIRAILPLFLTVFVDSISMGIILPVLTPLFFSPTGLLGPDASFFARELFFSLTLFSFAVGMFFATPVLGELSDEIGRKKILIFCLAGVAVSYLFSVIAILYASLGLLIFSRLIAGICAGAISTAQAAVIDVCPPAEKTKYLSLLLFPVSIGFVAGPLLSVIFTNTNLVASFNPATPLMFAGLVAVLNLIWLIYVFKETHVKKNKITLRLSSALLLFKHAFDKPAIRLLVIVFFFFEFAWALYFQYISVFMYQRFAYDNNEMGLFMACLALGFSVSFLYLIPKLTQRYSNLFLLLSSFVVSIVFNLVTVWVPFESVIWIATFINSVFNAIGYSTSLALFSDKIGEEHQGWIMGVTAAIFSLALGLTALLGGVLNLLNVDIILYTVAASSLIGLILCLRLKK